MKGQDNVYFWRYEDRGGRSRQVYVYMGQRRSAGTARRLADAVEDYYASSADDLRWQLVGHRVAIAALRGGPNPSRTTANRQSRNRGARAQL